MKDLIKKILKEETEEVLLIPGFDIFPDGERGFLNFLKKHGHKNWSFEGDLNFFKREILQTLFFSSEDLECFNNLVEVYGNLDLYGVKNLKHLNSLIRVDGDLDIRNTSVTSLESLEYVGGALKVNSDIFNSVLEQIKSGKLKVEGLYHYFDQVPLPE
jgi:hypothetical protein